jgi:hypothetical protein
MIDHTHRYRQVRPGRARSLPVLIVAAALLAAMLTPAAVEANAAPTMPPVGPVPVDEIPIDQIATDQTLDEPLAPGDIEARARMEGISTDEAARRLRADRYAAAADKEARERWPDSFAGLWVDHTNGYAIHAAFTSAAAAHVTDLGREFPAIAGDLVADTRSKNSAEFDALLHRVIDDRDQFDGQTVGAPKSLAATGGAYDVVGDIRTGTVHINVPVATASLRGEVRLRYGNDVVVNEAALAVPSSCQLTECRPAMLGGIKITNSTGGTCSSGFVVSASSTRFVLSAAHCYTDLGQDPFWHHGGWYYGGTNGWVKYGVVDAQRIRHETAQFQDSSKFFVVGEDPRMVTSLVGYSNVAVGSFLGKTGYRTGTSYGYVQSKTVAPSYVAFSGNFISVNACTYPGDSGGSVFSGNGAAGLTSGYFPSTSCNIGTYSVGGQGQLIYGAINYAIDTLEVNVLTGLNIGPSASMSSSCGVLLACSFSGAGSNDPDGSVRSWSWNFGDGTGASGPNVSHTYSLPGTYTVTLDVYDNNGKSGRTQKSVTVL